jgi:hypothetical protein
MSIIVNDVLFVDSHVQASLKLLFQVLEDIFVVRLSGEVPGCPLILLHSNCKKAASFNLQKETQNFSPCNCTQLQGPPGVNMCVSCLNITVYFI